MNALVTKEDEARVVAHRVPRVGHPELAEEDGVVARHVGALAPERDDGEAMYTYNDVCEARERPVPMRRSKAAG